MPDIRQVIIEVIENEAQDALDTGMRPTGGKELDAWNFVAKHFKQWAPFAADKIIEKLEEPYRVDPPKMYTGTME